MKDLLECATRVFIAQGYRQTQMADIAEAMGVAKGTLYLYVESKQALFAAALHYSDGQAPTASDLDLPIATPKRGALRQEIRARLDHEAVPPALERAIRIDRIEDVRAEFESILRELFAASSQHRTGIKLIDRCGTDHPDLGNLFFEAGRGSQLDLLRRYLDSRIRGGWLKPVPDLALAARFVIETIATWAVHIHWDPAPQAMEPGDAEDTAVHFLLSALLEDERVDRR